MATSSSLNPATSSSETTTASGIKSIFSNYKVYDPYAVEEQYNSFIGYPSRSERSGPMFLSPEPPESVKLFEAFLNM